MKLVDLGELDAPVLLFGGPYSNLQAMRALIGAAEAEGIPASHMICTGDLVAYCADAAETVALVRDLGCPVVAGNCEKQLAAYEMNCGCGFEEGTTCDLLSAGWYAHADRQIGEEDRVWMGGLPYAITFTHQGQRAIVVHGGMTDVSRFLWPCSEDADFFEEIEAIQKLVPDVAMVIAGHSGIPFQRDVAGVSWVNAGVIGMPPHDGSPETRYAILRSGSITVHNLSYDWQATESKMESSGLTQGYHTSLRSGYWPSEDILPPQLRRSSLASG